LTLDARSLGVEDDFFGSISGEDGLVVGAATAFCLLRNRYTAGRIPAELIKKRAMNHHFLLDLADFHRARPLKMASSIIIGMMNFKS
jgi:hypothetical protein